MTYHWVDCDRDFITQRYDRLADVIALFDWLFFLPSGLRKHAVDRLSLQRGDCVLEVGCGSGSNFPFLREAIGATGRIYGVDLSAGMLRKARKLSDRHHWTNIHLTEDDAANYVAPEPLDSVLFSLSYNTMPHHLTVLRRVWKQLRPGGRLVIMDSKLPPGLGGKLLLRFSLWMMRHTLLGNPYIRPWEHHAELVDNFEMQEFLFASYYVCRGVKPVNGVRASSQRRPLEGRPGRPRLQRRSARSWLRPCREGLNCGDFPRSGIRSRRSRPRRITLSRSRVDLASRSSRVTTSMSPGSSRPIPFTSSAGPSWRPISSPWTPWRSRRPWARRPGRDHRRGPHEWHCGQAPPRHMHSPASRSGDCIEPSGNLVDHLVGAGQWLAHLEPDEPYLVECDEADLPAVGIHLRHSSLDRYRATDSR